MAKEGDGGHLQATLCARRYGQADTLLRQWSDGKELTIGSSDCLHCQTVLLTYCHLLIRPVKMSYEDSILKCDYRFVREKPPHLNKVNFEYDFLEKSRQVNGQKSGTRSQYDYVRDGDFSIVWTNVTIFVLGHLAYFYAFYLIFTFQVNNLTWIFCK